MYYWKNRGKPNMIAGWTFFITTFSCLFLERFAEFAQLGVIIITDPFWHQWVWLLFYKERADWQWIVKGIVGGGIILLSSKADLAVVTMANHNGSLGTLIFLLQDLLTHCRVTLRTVPSSSNIFKTLDRELVIFQILCLFLWTTSKKNAAGSELDQNWIIGLTLLRLGDF